MATSMHIGSATPLTPDLLRRTCDPSVLGFETTAEVLPRDSAIGQGRAREAVAFGLGVSAPGYNIFATGPVGTGKRAALEHELRDHAAGRPDPFDVVYVHNFADERTPRALTLPAGRGRALATAMTRFIEDARRDLARAFESETHQSRRREAAQSFEHERDTALERLRESARRCEIALELTPAGVLTIPLVAGKPVPPDDFASAAAEVKEAFHEHMKVVGPEVHDFLAHMRALERDIRARLAEIDREAGLFAVGHLVDDLKEDFAGSEKLAEWLDAVRDDMIEHLGELHDPEPGQDPDPARYHVNVFVSHEPGDGGPVVVESAPTFVNLFGCIEHRGLFGGGFSTDHRFLRAGAVHRANGGYLLLPARDVLAQPLLWQRLKDVLQTGKARVENLGDQFALVPTPTLVPEPVELEVKTVLYGQPVLYELAWRYDEDLRKLFRVKADFEPRIPWNAENVADYAAFVSGEAARAGLLPFGSAAVARIVEEGARMAGHREWLSSRALEIAGLAAEASHWAGEDGAATVGAAHVEQAIEKRRARSDLGEKRLLDAVRDGTLMIDVDDARVGQVNGLAVIDTGDYAFGHPLRITATAGAGKGDVVSIEREVELSGPIHDKGFLGLRGYLESRYGGTRPLALSAHLTFEQSYEGIEGDSAAAAELFALLSDLAGEPLRQDVAVTGSVNQHGELQAIGGVNEKIEGFFRACEAKGLTGRQGVLVPAANVQHLMLAPAVVEAVRDGQFHVWSATTVDEGLELLTGKPAEAVHAEVKRRLAKLAAASDAHQRRGQLSARQPEPRPRKRPR